MNIPGGCLKWLASLEQGYLENRFRENRNIVRNSFPLEQGYL